MKNLFITATICLGLFFASCDKGDDTTKVPSSAKDYVKQHMDAAKQTVTFNTSELPKTFTFKGGVKITIPAGAFNWNGSPFNGPVTFEVYEMLKPSSIVFSGTNTNYNGGQYLLTDGFIYMNATSNGTQLDQRLGANLTISIPTDKADGAITNIWAGEINEGENENQFAWRGMGEGDFIWGAGNDRFPGDVAGKAGSFVFSFGKLGWANCDVLWGASEQKTTVTVVLTGKFGALASYLAQNGETFVLFCGKGYPVIAQLYTHLYTNQTSTAVQSYVNSMPLGAKGKMIAFSIKDGVYSLASQEITITADMNLTLDLKVVSQQQVESAIAALDNYK